MSAVIDLRTGEALTIYGRVTRKIPIFSAPGVHAAFVYDAISLPARGSCADCGDGPVDTIAWQEWEWKPGEGRFDYAVRRSFDLCEVCGDALRGRPLGEKWQRARSRHAVLLRCVRALEAVGHTAAVEALRGLVEGGSR